jgi:glycosyltransferase involved in cell wall biosynthesis
VNYWVFVVRAARTLGRQHKRRPFAFVQVNTMPDFLVLSTLVLRLRGVRVSVFMKEPTPELGYTLYHSRFWEKVLQKVEWFALRYAHLAFTVTPELRDTYVRRGADGRKIHVVLNGPDASNLEACTLPARRDPDRFVLVSHGTIEHRYGHDVMVEAIRIVKDKIPNVQLRITGSGDHVEALLALIERYQLGDHVVYLGWINLDEVIAEVKGANAGIVAQLSSPYSNLIHTQKMFEYIMLGVPCIATRLRSVSAAFSGDEILFCEPDDAQSLADVIVRLHDDPELAIDLVAKARRRYEGGYDWVNQKQILVRETLAFLGGMSPEMADRPARDR